MDPLPVTSFDSPALAASTANRPAVTVPTSSPIAPAPLTPDEEVMVQALIKRGLVTSDQVRTAQQYGSEHQCDLRQSILEPQRADRHRRLHPPGHEPGTGRGDRPPGRPALWRRARGRTGRRGQDLDALQLPGTDQLAAPERDDHRGSRSSTGFPASTRPRSTPRATWGSARACGPCSGRTPTSS